ncbi:MAG: hypothetical protein ACFB22_00085 [Rhodothalassiaceae bacterium]
MNEAISSFGVGRIAALLLRTDRPISRLDALVHLKANLGPYDQDGTAIEAAVEAYFATDEDRLAD